ncbi:hypothetical protein Poli38472_010274 [Pythium oligandrum]|uniref:RNA polymerase II assembly factor Rtp1 C-terminal domain-containing protein n=1 Tax=Pythium oligandrum TaxID=41045 RepID=A0A8K1C9E9_PYTOL|nr:hypothetical protein Poli38472_010274 [Pythium oligandrum]|eukprot:TMW58715.1 hypothetical protein Poli38472_010274 [Pythium oligandrum]
MELQTLVRTQHAAMRTLHAFVDALRDVQKEERVDEDVPAAIRRAFADERGGSDPLKLVTNGLEKLFVQLTVTMKRIDVVEQQTQPPAQRSGGEQRPKAPAGLLSLRDYSVLQAAIEVFFCWSMFPMVDRGILLPVGRRRPTKTLAITRFVLQWGSRVAMETQRVVDLQAQGETLLRLTRSLLQFLLLPQLQPILLPKYSVEMVALLVYCKTNVAFNTQEESRKTLDELLQVLPLRLSMTSLRAALGQSNPRATGISPFRQRCGQLLSRLLMKPGGVQTTIEMMLGAVDEGNTQARMQVATLICQCPTEISVSDYSKALTEQVKELLAPSNQANKLMRETAVVLVNEMTTRFDAADFDKSFLAPMFNTLLLYDDTRATPEGIPASERDVENCVGLLHLLLCGPPPSSSLITALEPLVRPLVHLHAFAVSSKSYLTATIEAVLIAFIKNSSRIAVLLQLAVLPVVMPLRESLLACGYKREGTQPWCPRRTFRAGGSGGVVLRAVEAIVKDDDDSMMLPLVVMTLVQLLSSKELETSTVVGELFSSLLLTYMSVRGRSNGSKLDESDKNHVSNDLESQHEALKQPQTAEGAELMLTLLLAIIESLGPSVLRSADTVLQCLHTVLEMYAHETRGVIDNVSATSNLIQPKTNDESVGEDENEDDEVLTVCLGVVMTILEAGASKRPEKEEAQLRGLLPVLEKLSSIARPQIAELASEARVRILSRGAEEKRASSASRSSSSFEEVLRSAQEDLASPLVPLRARGVVSLTKLVRASQSHRNEKAWDARIQQLLTIFMQHLEDAESYVFLAAVQGLSTLSDMHPDVAIPLLVKSLRDTTVSLEKRIKLGEALLFTAKRCGEMLPKYAKVFVYAYLDCIRPPQSRNAKPKKSFQLIQEIDPNEKKDAPAQDNDASAVALVEATLRASCLSNLAEVCALLGWALAPFAVDVLTCVFGILQLELDMASKSVVSVRRGAVFLLKYVLQLLGYKMVDMLPDQLKPLYHTLKHVQRVDHDTVVRFHAEQALQTLDSIMRAELFPTTDNDAALGLSALRIVKN